jgi:hypothetical protein
VTFTTVVTPYADAPSNVTLGCSVLDGPSGRSWVYAKARRMTAVRLGELEFQP